MEIREQVVLAPYTTMRVGGPADYFIEVSSVEELQEAVAFAKSKGLPLFVLGGGSNVIFSDEGYRGLVIRSLIRGLNMREDQADGVLLEIGAGESWDEAVAWAVSQGYWGIENLSLIPGLAGAVAIQNVGAYGQEASQVVEMVTAYDLKAEKIAQLSRHECDFAYRRSIFNTKAKGRYVICLVTLRLKKSGEPNLFYRDLQEYFEQREDSQPAVAGRTDIMDVGAIRKAVIAIRTRKLPDPATHPNTGSFFKNIIMDGKKISTAALIDEAGLKGYQIGGAKISEKHALVIENTGTATTADILELARYVQAQIKERFGHLIEIEPEIVHNEEKKT